MCVLPFPRVNEPHSFLILLLPKVIDNTFLILSQAAKTDFVQTICKEKEREMASFFSGVIF